MGHLRELHLDGNARIGDAGARIISECISNGNLNLEYLGLASCEIGNKGCSNLFDGLASAPGNLNRIHLGDNKLDATDRCVQW